MEVNSKIHMPATLHHIKKIIPSSKIKLHVYLSEGMTETHYLPKAWKLMCHVYVKITNHTKAAMMK